MNIRELSEDEVLQVSGAGPFDTVANLGSIGLNYISSILEGLNKAVNETTAELKATATDIVQ